ncbi:hypothetical protein MKX08_006529 [Trichoderma sp. CBMAI-0020]|nr:hypothetical protein MKX08_006529 [Trichoderma sp. CBMAI-0020]
MGWEGSAEKGQLMRLGGGGQRPWTPSEIRRFWSVQMAVFSDRSALPALPALPAGEVLALAADVMPASSHGGDMGWGWDASPDGRRWVFPWPARLDNPFNVEDEQQQQQKFHGDFHNGT